MRGIEAGDINPLRRMPAQFLGHHLTAPRTHDNAIPPAHRRGGGDNHHIPIAKHRFHGIAGNLQRIGIGVADIGQ